ncbi:MAG TPA: AMP-binding protein, partial [Thermoanaerobaculia bacterium]
MRAVLALGRREGATPFMTFLAAFQILLARCTGQDDIAVGTSIAGRRHECLDKLIGFFVNTLVLRTEVSGTADFRTVLTGVRETALDAYSHQDLPFERLVEELNVERDLSRTPLFQTMFLLKRADVEGPAPPGLVLEPLDVRTGMTNYDLTLSLSPGAGGMVGTIELDTDLFDLATIDRMALHLAALLQGIAESPDCRISALPLLAEPERHQLLVEWNDASVESETLCPHELFEQQAELTPEAVAVAVGGEEISYRDLDARANRLANHLRMYGVGPEVVVGLCVERSIEMVVGLLGIWKAGGAFVPLDPAYPSERLAFLMTDSLLPVLVAQEHLADLLPVTYSTQVVLLDADRAAIEGCDASRPAVPVLPDNLAYTLYTSGSTGRPKGVLISHRGLAEYLGWAAASYGLRSGGGTLVHTSISFDLTLTSLLVPLLRGETVHLVPDAEGLEGLAAALRRRRGLGFLKLTPSHVRLLGQQLAVEDLAGSCGALVVGGEALAAEDLAAWRQNAPETVVFNEYGPTETVVGCSVHARPVAELAPGPVPIGRPAPYARIHLFAADLQPVPLGSLGELCVGGPALA